MLGFGLLSMFDNYLIRFAIRINDFTITVLTFTMLYRFSFILKQNHSLPNGRIMLWLVVRRIEL